MRVAVQEVQAVAVEQDTAQDPRYAGLTMHGITVRDTVLEDGSTAGVDQAVPQVVTRHGEHTVEYAIPGFIRMYIMVR